MPTKSHPVYYRGTITRKQFVERTGITSVADDVVASNWTNSFTGVSNPSWRSQVRSHVNATTPASWSATDYESDQYCSVLVKDPVNSTKKIKVETYGRIIPGVSFGALIGTGGPDLDARLKFLGKVRDAKTAFQGGTFLGELREAVSGIKHPLKSLRKSVDQYANLARKNARRAARGLNPYKPGPNATSVKKALADTWLEWSYDKAPLINDIHDLAEAIVAAPRDEVTVISATGRSESFGWQDASYNTSFGNMLINWRLGIHKYTTVRYLGGVRFVVESPLQNELEKYGLSWSNFVPTVWNLIPYSFLVDYFTNAGDLIDAACAPAFQLAFGCRTVRQMSEAKLAFLKTTYVGSSELLSSQADNRVFYHINRVGSRSVFNRPDLDTNVLDLRLEIPGGNSRKWLNIAALWGSRKL